MNNKTPTSLTQPILQANLPYRECRHNNTLKRCMTSLNRLHSIGGLMNSPEACVLLSTMSLPYKEEICLLQIITQNHVTDQKAVKNLEIKKLVVFENNSWRPNLKA